MILFIAAVVIAMLLVTVTRVKDTEQSNDPEDEGTGWSGLSCLAITALGFLTLFFFLVGGSAGMK